MRAGTYRPRILPILALTLMAPLALSQRTFKSEKYGFEIEIPKDFHEVPIKLEEKYVVAKFLYKRQMTAKKAWASVTPEMRVIIFPEVDIKRLAKTKAKQQKAGVYDFENPYRNYKEYLRENYKKGGWHIESEKDGKIGGLPAKMMTISVKNTMSDGEVGYTLFAWEVDLGDAKYVIQFETLADYQKKFKGSIGKAARKFRKTEKYGGQTGAITTSSKTGLSSKKEKEINKAKEWESLTPEERRDRRLKDLGKLIDESEKRLPPGWKRMDAKPFTIFYDTSPKYAKMVAKQAKLMWKYLNDTYGFVGKEFATPSLIRICKSYEERNSYMDTSNRKDSFNLRTREIVTYEDRDWGWNDGGSFSFNAAVCQVFLWHKNPMLWNALPPWLDDGLVLQLSYMRMKGSKMISKPDEWSMEVIREGLREDNFKSARDIVVLKYGDYNKTGTADGKDRVQALAMVHFLVTKGSKKKKYKDVLTNYMGALDRILRETYKDLEKDVEEAIKKGTAKKGDDDTPIDLLGGWREKRDKIYDKCFEEVFKSWTDDDWKRFDHDWKKAFKG